MKNKWMKKVLVLIMCGALAVPVAGMAQPMVARAAAAEKTPEQLLAEAKKNAMDQLADYYDVL